MNCNLTTGTYGLPYNDNGNLTFYCVTLEQLRQILCHGLSQHGVTAGGGFHGGNNSFTFGPGVALGGNAKIVSSDGSGSEIKASINAIQLGEGTNSEEKTFKVFQWKLLSDLGKIPEERLPPHKIQLRIENNIFEWSYVDTNIWYPLLDISDLQGQDGIGFIPDAWGELTEAIITDIQNNTVSGRYIYIVNAGGDNRIDQTVPVGISGDMSGNILGYDADTQTWVNFGVFTGIPGEPGSPIELRNNGTWIQWRVVGDPTWINLIELSELKGDPGETGPDGQDAPIPEFRIDSGNLEYSIDEGVNWIIITPISALKGPAGEDGADGTPIELSVSVAGLLRWRYVGETTWIPLFDTTALQGQDGDNPEFRISGGWIQWKLTQEGTGEWKNLVELSTLTGPSGNDGSAGEPVEIRYVGTILQWKYESEPDTEWRNLADFGVYLRKDANTEYEGTGVRLFGITNAGGITIQSTALWNTVLPYPPKEITTNYTLLELDVDKVLEVNSTVLTTITIPVGLATDTGFTCAIYQKNTGYVQVVAASGVTLFSANNEVETRTRYSIINIIKLANNQYLLGGDLA